MSSVSIFLFFFFLFSRWTSNIIRFQWQTTTTTKKTNLPRKVALGELYAKYSLFDAHAGNSFCCSPSASSSLRFQGNWVSIAVGVVTRVSPEIFNCWTWTWKFAFCNDCDVCKMEKLVKMEQKFISIPNIGWNVHLSINHLIIL